MSFETESEKESLKINVVIKIGTTYFSRHAVDSGLAVEGKYQVVSKVNLASVSLDLRNIKTSIPSNTFELLDKDSEVTTFILANPTKYLGEEIEIYTGFITGSFPWSDYILSSRSIISTLDYVGNAYRITAKEITALTTGPLYRVQDDLAADINDSQTTLTLHSTALFPATGYVKIDNEIIQYTSNDFVSTLSGLIRGDLFSTPASHKASTNVYDVVKLEGNPMDLLLQIMISPGGGGTYDVLDYGMGIDQAKVDITGIELIKTTYFPSDVYRFYIYNQSDALSFIEDNLILPTNTRLITGGGKISLTYIDQTTPVKTINEDVIIGRPSWQSTYDKIVNRIAVKWSYSVGTDSYARTSIFENSESISRYGVKAITYNFHGIQADLNGQSIITGRMNKLLQRLKDPRQKIQVKSFFNNVNIGEGKTVTLIHRYIPGLNSLGINAPMNILEKGIDYNTGQVTLGLFYTVLSSAGIARSGVIAPSPFIVSVISQTSFEVPNGSFYEQGYKISIDGEIKEILSVVGNQITVVSPFIVILDASKRVKFPSYNLVSEAQKARYAFIGKNNNQNFDDGGLNYQIIP